MSKTAGLKYTPLFHSEISSSYLLHDVFIHHKNIVTAFLNRFLKIGLADEEISIEREHNYKGDGSIDLFIRFTFKGRETHVLIEVKVHDYTSATRDQITRYYNAAQKTSRDADVYFVYLTQFNKNNQPRTDNISIPPTIEVFDRSKNLLDGKKLTHVNWEEFHEFLEPFVATLSEEERTMVSLQKKWIFAQSIIDLSDNTNTVGQRHLSEYFDDITNDLEKALPFGDRRPLKNRLNYVIQLSQRSKVELEDIIQIITTYSNSANINKSKLYQTELVTITAVKNLLTNLVQNENNWLLLYFYASLFELINNTTYLKLYGTGGSGFSIKVNIIGGAEISLCTLRNNKTIEFALQR